MSRITGFHHIALRASNFDKTVEFYKALGMTECVRWGEGDGRAVMLGMSDGGRIEVFAGGENRGRVDERFLHLAFNVDDVDAVYEAAVKAGAVTKRAPYEASPPDAEPAIKMYIAFVYGPDGELLEFFKEI